MKRFIEGRDRSQRILLLEQLDDYVADSNPVRVVDVFVDELDLVQMGFEGTMPAQTGRRAYHPSILLKITSTAISIDFNPAVAWNVKRSVTLN